jgi:hypothetical protein
MNCSALLAIIAKNLLKRTEKTFNEIPGDWWFRPVRSLLLTPKPSIFVAKAQVNNRTSPKISKRSHADQRRGLTSQPVSRHERHEFIDNWFITLSSHRVQIERNHRNTKAVASVVIVVVGHVIAVADYRRNEMLLR